MSVRTAAAHRSKDEVRLLHVLSLGLKMHENRRLSPSIGGAHVEVRTSPVGGVGGKGLFASKEMAAGMEVAVGARTPVEGWTIGARGPFD